MLESDVHILVEMLGSNWQILGSLSCQPSTGAGLGLAECLVPVQWVAWPRLWGMSTAGCWGAANPPLEPGGCCGSPRPRHAALTGTRPSHG